MCVDQTLESVKKQLRKLDWKAMEPYIVKCLLKVHKCKYNQVSTPNPKPETLNPKPSTLNPNPKPENLSLNP